MKNKNYEEIIKGMKIIKKNCHDVNDLCEFNCPFYWQCQALEENYPINWEIKN